MLILRHLGIASGKNIASVYWRKQNPPPQTIHPVRDECGLIWVCPTVPFTAEHIEQALTIISSIMLRYTFEPAVSLSVISDKCVVIVTSIVFDKASLKESKKANTCKDSLFAALAECGYYPYRIPTTAMELHQGDNPNYAALLKKIKVAIDPNHILAPGRYNYEKAL